MDRHPDIEAKDQAYEAFRRLDGLNVGLSEEGEEIPTIRFDSEAQEFFDTWHADLEHRLRTEEMSPALEAHLAKYRSLMPSLSLLFELIDSESTPAVVGKTAVQRALMWCEYLESHARRLYSAAETPEMTAARTLLRRIHKGDVRHRAKVRDIYLKGWTGLSKPAEAKAALEVLEAYGWLRVVHTETGRPGRPAEYIELHPSLRGA